MTILFFCRLFYPHIGGVETHVLEVGKRLVKKGHKVIVLTEDYNDPYQPQGKSAKSVGEAFNIKIYRIGSGKDDWFRKFRIWFKIWKKRKLIQKADVVHCHDVFFWYLPFRFFYLKKPVFTTFHGYETRFPPSKKAIFTRKLSEWLSWGNICVGDYIKKWYKTDPNFITFGGIGKSQIANSKYQINKKPRILFIGRLEEDTGVPLYLHTLRLLKDNKINFEFQACGDGSLRSEVEKYGKVHGFVQNLDSFLSKADIIFASSYLSILQALAFKKPVYSIYDNPLKRDYLKMAPFTKWVIIKNSPKKLAKEVGDFLKRPKEKYQMLNKAYGWIENQTWENVAGVYQQLWRIYE